MTKVLKSTKSEQARNRLRLFRGVQSIIKSDNLSFLNATHLKKKISESIDKNPSPPKNLSDKLRTWAIEFRIQRSGVSELLKILISAGHKSLPRDSRSLLRTPRIVQIENRAGGQYWHHGIENNLKRIFAKLNSDTEIEMNFNMDGLPLFKSSPITFWPILANIHGMCTTMKKNLMLFTIV